MLYYIHIYYMIYIIYILYLYYIMLYICECHVSQHQAVFVIGRMIQDTRSLAMKRIHSFERPTQIP